MVAKRVRIIGSDKKPLKGARAVGPVSPSDLLEVTVRVRRRNALASPLDAPPAGPLSYDEFRDRHGAHPDDLEKVEAFAHEHGLSAVMSSPAQRSVQLTGTAAAMKSAFGVTLKVYQHGNRRFRGRTGAITIPAELEGIIEGVFGLDDRPAVQPHFRLLEKGKVRPAAAGGRAFTPTQVAQLYDFPRNVDGTGQTIAILEFGGGYRLTDLKKYFAKIGTKLPKVSAVSVMGGHNSPTGDPNSADGEVMLDIEVAGAIAPGARILVYFAPNSDAGFLGALYAAVHDSLRKPSVISISWGSPELGNTAQSRQDFDNACVDAAALGITICVAAGDHGSADTDPPGTRANVDFPASSPHVLACGGTHLEASGGAISRETVWNTHDGWATGGGVSEAFPIPSYQKNAGVPPSVNPPGNSGRGVPDVSGDADAQTGYIIRVDGLDSVSGGTSAVAPLWSSLIALLNQAKGRRLGFVNASLYALPNGSFRDITVGDNGGYQARPGWDACTGLGSPRGADLAKQLP
jgi:kumamolisin